LRIGGISRFSNAQLHIVVRCFASHRNDGQKITPRKNIFIIFVDEIFTTLFERLFTNVFDVIGAKSANHCVCHACHAD